MSCNNSKSNRLFYKKIYIQGNQGRLTSILSARAQLNWSNIPASDGLPNNAIHANDAPMMPNLAIPNIFLKNRNKLRFNKL